MKKLIIAAILGGLVVFIYSSLAWMVLPFHSATMNTLPMGEEITQQLKEMNLETGVYHFPGMFEKLDVPEDKKEQAMAEWVERYKRGPILSRMLYISNGLNPFMAKQFIFSILFNIISAFIVSYMLSTGVQKMPKYFQRVGFVLLAGLFASIVFPLTELNWWGYPLDYTFANMFDGIVGWGLAGLVIARFVKA